MADITGQRHTLGLTQGLREIDIKKTIMELEPSATPLCTLSMRLPKNSTHNPEFKWAESALRPRFSGAAGAVTNVATTMSVTATQGNRFAAGDLVKNTRTAEVFRIDVMTGDVVTTMVRGVGNAGVGIAMNDLDELIRIGSVATEGADKKVAISPNPTLVTNYTQIFRYPYDATGTDLASTSFVSPDDWTYAANHASIEFKKDHEYVYWLGRPSELTEAVTGKAIRTTGGALYYITTNVTDMGGGMTEAEFFGSFRGAFRYGDPNSKTLFASQIIMESINTYPRSKLDVVQSDHDKSYGVDIKRFVSPFGNLTCVTELLFEGTKYGGMGAILDMSKLERRPLEGNGISRDVKIRQNIQNPGVDGRTDELLSEEGLVFANESAHALITNVTGPA